MGGGTLYDSRLVSIPDHCCRPPTLLRTLVVDEVGSNSVPKNCLFFVRGGRDASLSIKVNYSTPPPPPPPESH